MQFIQSQSWKVYPTWVARYYNYRIYIHKLVVMGVYHFKVRTDSKLIYDSIEEEVYFSEFDEIIEYIEEWVKNNLIEKRTVYSELQFE